MKGFASNVNPGFENGLTNWGTTGSGWGTNTLTTKLRSGNYACRLNTTGITAKKLYNSYSTVTVNDNISKFVTFNIYIKSNKLTSSVKLGFYDINDATETVQTIGSIADSSSFIKISFTMVGQVSHTYYPIVYANNSVTGSISIYFDDASIYLSSYSGNDNNSPDITTTLTANCSGSSIQLNFNQGSDNESGSTGIMILRKSGIASDTPSVANQVFYSSSNSIDGPTSVSGWKVMYNDSLISSYTDDPGAMGKYTYLIFMRDAAMNYSMSATTGRIFVINYTTTNYVLNANAITDGLYLPSGCNLFIRQGVTLEIKPEADIHIYGAVYDSGSFLNDLEGSVTFENGSNYKYCRDGNAMYPIVSAAWQNNSTCIVSGIVNTAPTGTDQTFGNFQWNCTAQLIDVDLDAAFAVNGSFTLAHSGTKTVWMNGDTYLKGDLIRTAGTLNYRSSSNLLFIGTTLQNINYATTFHKLTIDNSAGVKLSKTVTVDSTLFLTTGAFDQNGFTLKIASGATISRGIGSVTANPNFIGTYNLIYTSPVTTSYELTTAQTKLNNLTLNCSGTVTLAKHANVNGVLTFINGKISTGSYEVRNFNSNTTAINGYNANSYIIGVLNRSVSSTGNYDFPVGTSSYYELISLHLNGSAGISSVRGSFNQINPGLVPTGLEVNSTPVLDLLDYGYWTLTPNSTLISGTYDVICNMQGQSNGPSNAQEYCVLKREDNTEPWQSLGIHDNSTQSITGGTVTAERTVLSSFSDYAIGYGGIELPVQLSYFKAEKKPDNEVELNWKTESEISCESFGIERSTDGKHFTEINSVKGNGTTTINHQYTVTDNEPLMGENYYRLNQKNSNGSSTYSQLCRVIINSSSISFYPNPVKDEMNLNLSAAGMATIKIYNLYGELIYTETVTAESISVKLNLSFLISGNYLICIKQNDTVKTLKFRKE